MLKNRLSFWRIYGFAVAASFLIAALIGWRLGAAALVTTLILAGIEISFSFENAIINAKILQRMSRRWQLLFLTVGILIAVFVVRLLLPLFMVAVAAHLRLSSVIDLALHHPEQYSQQLDKVHPIIAAFGGMFLLMIFLDFIFETRPILWLEPIERRLAKLGKLESLSVIIAALVLLITSLFFAADGTQVWLAGVVGILSYVAINTLESSTRLAGKGNDLTTKLIKGGLIGFLYLELIDASFSLDSVIGAFAITTNIILITAGLAIGALFVRAMTVHIMQRGTIKKYIYLDHGAHYAIGLLSLLLLLSVRFELPEWLTGLSGITIIAFALLDSYFEAKRKDPNINLL